MTGSEHFSFKTESGIHLSLNHSKTNQIQRHKVSNYRNVISKDQDQDHNKTLNATHTLWNLSFIPFKSNEFLLFIYYVLVLIWS